MTRPSTSGELLVIVAVDREAEAVRAAIEEAGLVGRVDVVAGGVGRVNAAVTLTRTLLERTEPPAAVLNAGVAGSLPSADPLEIGETIIAAASVYHEEGLIHEQGFSDLAEMGFPLLRGAEGNRLPANPFLASAAVGELPNATLGVVATVATCSGTDAHAAEVRRRTRAMAEAMEGAAVLHAAALMRVPALEIRTISNTTGDRGRQRWDLELALSGLRRDLTVALGHLLETALEHRG